MLVTRKSSSAVSERVAKKPFKEPTKSPAARAVPSSG